MDRVHWIVIFAAYASLQFQGCLRVGGPWHLDLLWSMKQINRHQGEGRHMGKQQDGVVWNSGPFLLSGRSLAFCLIPPYLWQYPPTVLSSRQCEYSFLSWAERWHCQANEGALANAKVRPDRPASVSVALNSANRLTCGRNKKKSAIEQDEEGDYLPGAALQEADAQELEDPPLTVEIRCLCRPQNPRKGKAAEVHSGQVPRRASGWQSCFHKFLLQGESEKRTATCWHSFRRNRQG